MSDNIKIYDCTLREGAQASGISFSVQDKIKIAELLDDMGFTYTEGGWPGANVKDTLFFEALKSLRLKQIKVVAFGRTKLSTVRAEDDANLNALVRTGVRYGHVFGKGWDLHVREVLGISTQQNLESIYESVRFLKKHMEEVSFGFEHFFDAYKENSEGAMKVIEAAVEAGVDWIDLADTNGGCFPNEIAAAVSTITKSFGIDFAVHCHNDTGCAVANTIAAVQNGVRIVEGTINGYSERCGMADLCTVIPNLQLKFGYKILEPDKLRRLTQLSLEVADILQAEPLRFHPYVGSLAFTHKGGVHVDAFLKQPRTYQHIDPGLVGNRSEIVLSEVSGKSNLTHFLRKQGLDHLFNSEDVKRLVGVIKQLEANGYEFNTVEEPLILFLLRECGKLTRRIQIKRRSIKLMDSALSRELVVGARNLDDGQAPSPALTEAALDASAIEFDADIDYFTADGIFRSERMQLSLSGEDALLSNLVTGFVAQCARFFPELAGVKLTDFKVRAIHDGQHSNQRMRVTLEFGDGSCSWKMSGVSTSVSTAALNATIEAIEYRLCMDSIGLGASDGTRAAAERGAAPACRTAEST